MIYTLQRKLIHIEEIGEVLISKSKTNKRICLRVTPKQIKVSMPYYYTFKDGERFVIEKKDWIKNVISKISHRFSIHEIEKLNLINGSICILRNGNCQISIKKSNQNTLTVELPEILTSDQVLWVENQLLRYVRREAKKYLTDRTQYLASIHALNYTKLKISSAFTRWGSCSSRNQINLNYRLMFLPEHLIDYVILHELAHTIHKNHGTEFWQFLNKLLGNNAKQLNKELKSYRIHEML